MSLTSWLALAGLGAFHGLNPGMGWLFAVAIGLRERSTTALLRALPPIAAGHAVSLLAFATLVVTVRSIVATHIVAIAGGVLLVGFGLYRSLSRRHFRWTGLRPNAWELASWSFLMSSVHGAGLMLLPILVTGLPEAHDHRVPAGRGALDGLLAVGVHTAAMTLVAAAIAVVVYRVVGLSILRSAWINFDLVWAVALVGSGAATVAVALS